jgi:hypothetical protein
MQRRIQRLVGMILSLAAAGAILFVAGRLSSGPGAPPPATPAALASAPRTDAPAAREASLEAGTRSPAPELTVHTGTIRELLEAHYGMPWETVRGLLADEDVDPGRVARLCEWDEVAPQMRREVLFSDGVVEADTVRSALSWGGLGDGPSWYGGLLNPEKKPLAEVDLQNLERMNAEYDSRLRDLADAANQMIPRCMAEQFDRQDFARAPLVETKDAASGSSARASSRDS